MNMETHEHGKVNMDMRYGFLKQQLTSFSALRWMFKGQRLLKYIRVHQQVYNLLSLCFKSASAGVIVFAPAVS